MIVTAHNLEDYNLFVEFGNEHKRIMPPFEVVKVLGRMNGSKRLTAMVVFDGFVRRTCSAHTVGVMTPDLLKAGFRYIFGKLDLVQMLAPTAADNHKLLHLIKFLGFKELYHVPQGWDKNTDLIMLAMFKTECRWLKER